jgi:hypothetical protein
MVNEVLEGFTAQKYTFTTNDKVVELVKAYFG